MTLPTRPVVAGDLGIDVLRAAYRTGSVSPVAVVEEVYERIEARGEDGTWISLVPREEALARAAALDPSSDLPLLGLPFAVKDNIDVAGMVTTAACPGFGYVATTSAPLVDAVLAAGAVLVGKTNLDQFATGLSGARSPYGVPSAVGDPTLISGGSSSGSAVAVAAGLVSFAIGTDTAGSGRVPAALNGIVGVKPSIGLVGTTGIVPACRSLDCASVFAGSVADATAVLGVLAASPREPGARALPRPGGVPPAVRLHGLRFAVPAVIDDWGTRGEQDAWARWCARLVAAGIELVPVDPSAFLEAGALLYDGPWVAERLAGVRGFVDAEPEALLDVTRGILESGRAVSGVEVFAAAARLADLRRTAHASLADVDALLTPTVTSTFTVEEMLADPVALNSRLGRWTTFTNLLDLCAVALPAGGPAEAPFGVTLQAEAGRDGFLAGLARALEGAPEGLAPEGWTSLAVVGAHLRGMPLHGDLTSRGAVLEQRTTTADCYRLYALAGGPPARPGLRRVAEGGSAIELEVYRVPTAEIGGFLATVPPPLGLGTVVLADGSEVTGFVCEEAGFAGARDVTEHGGWRAYLAHGGV